MIRFDKQALSKALARAAQKKGFILQNIDPEVLEEFVISLGLPRMIEALGEVEFEDGLCGRATMRMVRGIMSEFRDGVEAAKQGVPA